MDAGTVLQIVGITSLLGVMAFLTAYYAFPPNLSVEEGKYKGKHNFESRLIVQNIGKMPAYNVVIDVKKMNFRVDGILTEDMNTEDCGVPTKALAASEKMEIPACPHVYMPVGSSLDSCDYMLVLKYDLPLPFHKFPREKCFDVELRNSGSDFTWQVRLQ
jgi:hypothetical protein